MFSALFPLTPEQLAFASKSFDSVFNFQLPENKINLKGILLKSKFF